MNGDEFFEWLDEREYYDTQRREMEVIDFFCLPDEFQDFDLTDEMASDIDFYEAMGRNLAEGYGYGITDADFPEGCENW